MTKSDLVNVVAHSTGLDKKKADEAVAAVFSAITTALSEGDKVSLVGFGSFEVKERKERTGTNPATGKKITIKASKAPTFKAGKALKDAVNPEAPAPKK